MLNETRIPGQRVPIAEDESGVPTREWFRYFEFLYTVAATSATNAAFYDTTSTAWTANTPFAGQHLSDDVSGDHEKDVNSDKAPGEGESSVEAHHDEDRERS